MDEAMDQAIYNTNKITVVDPHRVKQTILFPEKTMCKNNV